MLHAVYRFSSFFNLAEDRFLFVIIFFTISYPFFSEFRKTTVRSLTKEDSLLGKKMADNIESSFSFSAFIGEYGPQYRLMHCFVRHT